MGDKDQSVKHGGMRREVIIGAGAVTATLGAITMASAGATAETTWDRETDILVVGSGAVASTAAVTAHQNGDAVVVVEKAPVKVRCCWSNPMSPTRVISISS